MTLVQSEIVHIDKSGSSISAIIGHAARQISALIKSEIQRKKNQHQRRLAFLQMQNLEDNILQDIGISREDLNWASKLPEHVNAAKELETIRKQSK